MCDISIWEFPKIVGTFWGVPKVRIRVYIGVHIFGETTRKLGT